MRNVLHFTVNAGALEGEESLTNYHSGSYKQWLGTAPIGGTITGALRQFNLPTSRAPGDWPEPCRHTVRY